MEEFHVILRSGLFTITAQDAEHAAWERLSDVQYQERGTRAELEGAESTY